MYALKTYDQIKITPVPNDISNASDSAFMPNVHSVYSRLQQNLQLLWKLINCLHQLFADVMLV